MEAAHSHLRQQAPADTLAYNRPATGGSTLIPAANLSPQRRVSLHRPGSFRCLRHRHGIRPGSPGLRPTSA